MRAAPTRSNTTTAAHQTRVHEEEAPAEICCTCQQHEQVIARQRVNIHVLSEDVIIRDICIDELLKQGAAKDTLISALQTANANSNNLIISLFNTNQQLSADLAAKQAEYDASEEKVRALRRELMFMEADYGFLQDQLAEAKHALVYGGSSEQSLAAPQSLDTVIGPDTPPAAFSAPAADASVPAWQTAGTQDWSGRSAGGLFGSGNSSTTNFAATLDCSNIDFTAQAICAPVYCSSNEQSLSTQDSGDSASGPETPPAAFGAPAADSSVSTWQTAGSQDRSGQSTGGLFGSGSGSTTTLNISGRSTRPWTRRRRQR